MTLIINQSFSKPPLIIYHISCYIVNIDIWLRFVFWHEVIMLIAICKKCKICFTTLSFYDKFSYNSWAGKYIIQLINISSKFRYRHLILSKMGLWQIFFDILHHKLHKIKYFQKIGWVDALDIKNLLSVSTYQTLIIVLPNSW